MKRSSFFKQWPCRYCCMDALHRRYQSVWRKSLRQTKRECCKPYWTSLGCSTPQSSNWTATYHPSRKLSKLDKPDMQDTTGEVRTNLWMTYFCGLLHIDKQRQDDQLEAIDNSSVLIQDVDLKTYQKRWTREKGGGRGIREIHADGTRWWWWLDRNTSNWLNVC